MRASFSGVSTCSNASRTNSALFSGSIRLTYRKYALCSRPSRPRTSALSSPSGLGAVGNEIRLFPIALKIIFGDLARVGHNRAGQKVASHSEIKYQVLARKFHFLRLRSRPSTFNATGMPNQRGQTVKIALAALQYSAASTR